MSETMQNEEPGATRSGFVALIGAPNAGKSTLVNQLVGAKVSIVTHKVQTTRAIVRGIATHDAAQIVFESGTNLVMAGLDLTHQFLIDREGNVIARYAPADKPEDIARDIEALL